MTDPLIGTYPTSVSGAFAGNGQANSYAALPSAAEMRERRRREEHEGYPLTLPHDGITVWVRLIDVFDRATIMGLPSAVQRLLLKGVNASLGVANEKSGFDVSETLDVIDGIDEAADMACLRGFVKPRLVRTLDEADAANDPMVWPLSAVHPRDRKFYFRVVSGQEAKVEQEMLTFRRGSLAGVENPRPDGSRPVSESALRPVGDAPGRVLRMAEAGA